MALFTTENAAEMALRSVEARKHRRDNPAIIPLSSAIDQSSIEKEQLARVSEQIRSIDDELESCPDAKSWDMLTRAKERLFKQWTWLAGIPGPGNRRPRAESNSRRPTVSPIEPETPPVAT